MVGRFISIEGIDGAGKSTIAKLVTDKIVEQGHRAVLLDKNFVPTDDIFSDRVKNLRDVLWSNVSPSEITKLPTKHLIYLTGAWFSLLEAIVLESENLKNHIIVADGWKYKLLARFRIKNENALHVARNVFDTIGETDKTFFLKISPECAANRRKEFSAAECGMYDGFRGNKRSNFVSYQSNVLKQLEEFSLTQNWIDLDSEQPIETLVTSIVGSILKGTQPK